MIEKPASVRYATPADEDGIMGLCRLLAEENGMFDMDEDKVRYALQRAVNYDRTICGVIGPSGTPYGAILLFVGAPWYSKADVQILEELFNFVHPDHRKGASHAVNLMEFAKHVSDDLGIVLQIGVLSNIKTEAKVRLYKRHLQYVGAFFTHNQHLSGRTVEWGSPPRTKMTTPERRRFKREKERLRVEGEQRDDEAAVNRPMALLDE